MTKKKVSEREAQSTEIIHPKEEQEEIRKPFSATNANK